jgi:hypothetical protein
MGEQMRHMEQRLRDAEAAREEAADADVAGSLPLLRQVEAMSTAAATHRAGAAQVSRVMQHMSSILKPHERVLEDRLANLADQKSSSYTQIDDSTLTRGGVTYKEVPRVAALNKTWCRIGKQPIKRHLRTIRPLSRGVKTLSKLRDSG